MKKQIKLLSMAVLLASSAYGADLDQTERCAQMIRAAKEEAAKIDGGPAAKLDAEIAILHKSIQQLGHELGSAVKLLFETQKQLFDAESRNASQVMAYENALSEKDEALERMAAEIRRLTLANQALEADNTILKATVQAPRHASASRARMILQPPLTEEERQWRMQSPLQRAALSSVDGKDADLK